MTATRVPFASAAHTLTDDADLTFDGDTLATNALALPTTVSASIGTICFNSIRFIHAYGTANIFAGSLAGNYTLTGIANTGVGSDTGQDLTSGQFNTFIAANSGKNCTEGAFNTGIGPDTLRQLTTGNSNIAIGYQAGILISTGDGNLFFGELCGIACTSGTGNVGIGSSTLRGGLTTTNQNTAIGTNSGYNTTGARSVFIGYGAGFFETAGNKLFIDNAWRADIDDGRVKAMVYGVFAAATADQYFTVNGHLIALEDLTTAQVLTPEIKTDTATPTDLTITCGAAKTLVLATSVYDDLQFPVATGKVTPASGEPTWETFTTNTKAFAFDVNDYIDLQANEIPHTWNEGTIGHLHLHFAIKTAQSTGADRYAKFTAYVASADVGDAFTETSFTAEKIIPTGSSALEHFYLDLGDITLAGKTIETEVKIRIRRIAATSGTEYADDTFLTQVGMHLEKTRLGSRAEFTS